jgi:ankyrin repeat protein
MKKSYHTLFFKKGKKQMTVEIFNRWLDLANKDKIEELKNEISNNKNIINKEYMAAGGEETTFLFSAIGDLNKTLMKLLIENGANVNAVTKEGRTALMYAAYYDHYSIAKLLIENRTDVNAVCGLEMAKLLIENGANVNAVTKEGRTALMYAVYYDHYSIAKLLIENRTDVNLLDINGRNALMYFFTTDRSARIKLKIERRELKMNSDELIDKVSDLLIQKTKDTKLVDNYGLSAYDYSQYDSENKKLSWAIIEKVYEGRLIHYDNMKGFLTGFLVREIL